MGIAALIIVVVWLLICVRGFLFGRSATGRRRSRLTTSVVDRVRSVVVLLRSLLVILLLLPLLVVLLLLPLLVVLLMLLPLLVIIVDHGYNNGLVTVLVVLQ